jgi:RNA polymerase sigma-70 factor (ECF subfamily)
MINTTLNHIKKHKRYDLIEDNESTSHFIQNQQDLSPDSITALSHAELLDMLHELPDGYRVVFNLYAIEGYNHREIGEQLGISEGTSKSQLNRARKQLQKLVLSRTDYRRSV